MLSGSFPERATWFLRSADIHILDIILEARKQMLTANRAAQQARRDAAKARMVVRKLERRKPEVRGADARPEEPKKPERRVLVLCETCNRSRVVAAECDGEARDKLEAGGWGIVTVEEREIWLPAEFGWRSFCPQCWASRPVNKDQDEWLANERIL